MVLVERQSKANEEYISKMQRKFAVGAKGTHMLKRNAVLKKRLEARDTAFPCASAATLPKADGAVLWWGGVVL